MLSVVLAIARQTASATPGEFIERFSERIQALAASQDLLVQNKWKGVDLNELVQSQLAHFRDLIGTRIELQGPPLFVSASAAQAIGMALHELATNGGKYGALANGDGRVEIEWSLERTNAVETAFVMAWREQGAVPITPPSKRGFGSTVICDMAGMSLDAEVDLDFPPAGLTWWLRCPAENVLKGVDPAPAAGRARQGRRFGERVDDVRCRKSSEPFSGTSRTGLRRTKTEIGKWRAETAAVKPAAGEPKFEDCWPETSA